ncbi:MAG: hypothetical protein Q9214_004801 [Letrouitia sp. 1 TL-2023]
MPETQPEQDDKIQAFRRWISSTRRQGIGGSSHATQCEFIPASAVKEYLEADDRVERLLESLFDSETVKELDAEVIREHYLRPLAILLLIGEGRMIKHFIKYQSLEDHRLPYRTCPDDFPFSSDPNLFERFYNQQWQFCATYLDYNMNLHLHKEDILPITLKEKIGSGGNAVIFKVIVEKEYNKLVPPRWKTPHPQDLRNTFVLKTYQGPDAEEHHKRERNAFMNLRYDKRPSPFIIAYHGSFVDDDTFNIILEYADRGNLEDFMKATPEPLTGEDMIEFWDRLSNITHGLALIHSFPGDTSSNFSVLLGWHQNIKPANILVFSGSGTSSYDVYFKIAELSLCHFKTREAQQPKDSGLNAFGTRAYGAPETFKLESTLDRLPVGVRRDADVWSVGCVFSEAAVWSRFGWRRVLEYRFQRQQELKRSLDLDGEHLFHGGGDVLPIVLDTHKHMVKTPRMIDHVTIQILRILDEDVLLNENEPRCSAKQVFYKSKRIIRNTRKRFCVPTRDVLLDTGDAGSASGDEERPKTPPCVPPGYVRSPGLSPRRLAGTSVNTLSLVKPLSSNDSTPPSPSMNVSGQHHSRGADRNYQHRDSDSHLEPLRSDLQDPAGPPSPTYSYQSSLINRVRALAIDTRDADHSRRNGRPHCETRDGVPSNAGNAATDKALLRRSQLEKQPSNYLHRYGVESSPDSFKRSTSPTRNNKLPIPPPLSPLDGSSQVPSPEVKIHNVLDVESKKPQHETRGPNLSLNGGLLWKERKKKGYHSVLNGQENLAYLNERDHIFVIDNTESMRLHRPDVLNVVSLLAYMLKDLDSNGLDVCFTHSTQKVNSGKSRKLSTVVSQVDFRGKSDMRTCLSRLFHEHKNKFGTTIAPSRSWYRRHVPPTAQKPLSFYILTDGNWLPNEVGPIIIDLVNRMQSKGLLKDHVGIQFIRFGENQQGIARLNHLDRGLGLKAIDMWASFFSFCFR